MICDFIVDGSWQVCQRCGRRTEYRGKPYYIKCLSGICPHLGPTIEASWGVTLKVKCGCGRKEMRDVFHAAHECSAPENKTGRCLPTLIPVDNEKWLARDESKLYRCCRLCELNPGNARE